jgi:hypothetical protein
VKGRPGRLAPRSGIGDNPISAESTMDAADLRVFEAVARLGGMNRAATQIAAIT